MSDTSYLTNEQRDEINEITDLSGRLAVSDLPGFDTSELHKLFEKSATGTNFSLTTGTPVLIRPRLGYAGKPSLLDGEVVIPYRVDPTSSSDLPPPDFNQLRATTRSALEPHETAYWNGCSSLFGDRLPADHFSITVEAVEAGDEPNVGQLSCVFTSPMTCMVEQSLSDMLKYSPPRRPFAQNFGDSNYLFPVVKSVWASDNSNKTIHMTVEWSKDITKWCPGGYDQSAPSADCLASLHGVYSSMASAAEYRRVAALQAALPAVSMTFDKPEASEGYDVLPVFVPVHTAKEVTNAATQHADDSCNDGDDNEGLQGEMVEWKDGDLMTLKWEWASDTTGISDTMGSSPPSFRRPKQPSTGEHTISGNVSQAHGSPRVESGVLDEQGGP